jgi:hypothetical protein
VQVRADGLTGQKPPEAGARTVRRRPWRWQGLALRRMAEKPRARQAVFSVGKTSGLRTDHEILKAHSICNPSRE